MQSLNVIDNNIDKIAQLFPNCVTERIGKDGKPEKAIDFDKLKAELTNDVLEEGEERYQFTWPGKRAASRLANETITQTLRPCREESVDFDNTQNLYIEGDNLDVLKVLRETYLGKVKMIYIDPPYNTGNDFVYNDDFAQGKTEFEQNSGLFDEEGNQTIDPMQRNTESNGRFHTDWLNMIYPRLKVAKDLLTDDGVIFISIDDSEIANLKKISDEVFGEKNFVGNMVWQSRTSISNDDEISNNHNHTIIYSKERDLLSFGGDDISHSEYSNPDNDPRGPWKLVPIDANHVGGDTQYPIRNPKTGVEYLPPNGRCWCYNSQTMQNLMEDGRIKFGLTDESSPKRKLFLYERLEKGDSKTPSSLILDAGTTKTGTSEIMDLFDGMKVFDYPKPTSFIERLVKYGYIKDGDIVLDFFSGSGTTANSVIKYNSDQGIDCKYILVQIPEDLDETIKTADINAKKAIKCAITFLDKINKPHLLTEIGKERIRRAGKKIKDDELDKLNEELNYLVSQRALVDNDFWCNSNELENKIKELEDKIKKMQRLDTGFRVLKLDSSNMNDVYYTPEEFSLNTLFSENVKEDRTAEDLLFQVMLDLGIELSAKIEKQEIAGKEVFLVDENYLIACFDKDVNETTITEIAKMHPVYFVMRDASAASDKVIDNFDQLFEAYSKDTVRKIL